MVKKKIIIIFPAVSLTHSFSQVSSELAWAADWKELASAQGLRPAETFCMHIKSDDPDVSTHRFSVIPKTAQLDPIFFNRPVCNKILIEFGSPSQFDKQFGELNFSVFHLSSSESYFRFSLSGSADDCPGCYLYWIKDNEIQPNQKWCIYLNT